VIAPLVAVTGTPGAATFLHRHCEVSTHVDVRSPTSVVRQRRIDIQTSAALSLVQRRLMPREAYLPIFFGDFLSSTVYWRGEEKGLYLLLLGYQWSSGPLPMDVETLAQVVGYESQHFLKLWERVGKKFVRTTGGSGQPGGSRSIALDRTKSQASG
jgi:hypothetical protein